MRLFPLHWRCCWPGLRPVCAWKNACFGSGLVAAAAHFLWRRPGAHAYLCLFYPLGAIGGRTVGQRLACTSINVSGGVWRWLAGAWLLRLTVVFGLYAAWYFAFTQVEALKTWPAHTLPGYWTPSYTKQVDSLYGFPMANGWKVVGALYADGEIQGDYETNERYLWIPHWYTLGQHRCGSTAEWYFAIDNLEPWTFPAHLEDLLKEQGYVQWGQVLINQSPRMTIYHQGDANHAPPVQNLDWEAYTARFDQVVNADLPLISPIVEEQVQNPVRFNFGNDIWLEGYAIEHNQALKPGDSFRLTLYWRGQHTGIPDYKVFNQAYYGNGVMVAQKDAIPVCDRERTSLWSPGELIVDIHDIPVADDAPPGVYPLHTGLYRQDDGTRAQVLDVAGNAIGDSVQLAEIEIVAP